LGALSRELERKRQVGELTNTERLWLRQIDALTERIYNFNRESYESQPNESGTVVYDMDQKIRLEESQSTEDPGVAKISNEEAEKIIETLDKQFEEKVMNRIRKQNDTAKQKVETDRVSVAEVLAGGSASGGMNLQDYMTAIRAKRPTVPFADNDSHFDLSKLATKP